MYEVLVTPEAQTDFQLLPASMQSRLLDKLEWMGENAEFLRHEAMQGNDWPDCFKYRIGSYRIIYRLEPKDRVLRILKVGHRRNVYK